MQGLIWIHFPHFFNHSTYALFFIEFNLYTFQQKLYVEFLLRDANILMSNLQAVFITEIVLILSTFQGSKHDKCTSVTRPNVLVVFQRGLRDRQLCA